MPQHHKTSALPKAFSKIPSNTWRQCFLFIACYGLLNYGYFQIPIATFTNVIYYHGVVRICAAAINLLVPAEQVLAQQNYLLSAKANLEIVRGCDGAGVVFLLISALLVFPGPWLRKLSGLLLGIGLVYGINLLRISGLYFLLAYQPQWFLLAHTYLAPTFMVLFACAYFAFWTASANEAL